MSTPFGFIKRGKKERRVSTPVEIANKYGHTKLIEEISDYAEYRVICELQLLTKWLCPGCAHGLKAVRVGDTWAHGKKLQFRMECSARLVWDILEDMARIR